MKQQFLSNKKYQQMIYKIFLTCICVIILCEALLFFPIMSRRSARIYRSGKQNELNAMCDKLEYLYGSMWETATKISLNPDLVQCFFRTSPVSDEEFSRRLKNYGGMNNIDSIYIYNEFQNRIYASNMTSASIEKFVDQEAVEFVRRGPSETSYALYYRPSPTNTKYNFVIYQNKFTLVFYPYRNAELAIVVNASADYIRELYHDSAITAEGAFFVTDATGQTTLTSDIRETNTVEEALIPYMSGIGANNPPETVRSEGETYWLFYTYSKDLRYHFAWMIPKRNSDYFQIFSDIMFLFIITALVFLLGLLIMFVGVKRLSRPLERLFDGMQSAEKNVPLAKDGALKKIISSVLTEKELEKMKDLSPVFACETLFLVKVCIDDVGTLEHFRKASDRELYKYGMMNICKELFERNAPAEAISDSADSILMIASAFDCESTLLECRSVLEGYLETTVTFVISDPYPLS